MNTVTSFPSGSIDHGTRSAWAWFVALGAACVALGLIAALNLYAATVASVYLVGIIMLVGAVVQVMHAFQVRRLSGFFVWLLSGVLYGAAGITAFVNPLLAAAVLTLMLAFALIFSGVMRIWWSNWLRPLRGWGWITASGVITVLVGIIFVIGWPANVLWLLGMPSAVLWGVIVFFLEFVPYLGAATAVVVATALAFNTQVQADPGQGAVVTHIDRDHTGWFYAVSPDGQSRLDVVLSGQGDFHRLNPDGTLTSEIVEPKTSMTVSVLVDGDWVPMWVGSGSLHDNSLVVQAADGSFESTGEASYQHVEGKLTNLLDGSEWSLLVVAVIRDYEFKELKIDLQPR